MKPRNVYGVTKLTGYHLMRVYRNSTEWSRLAVFSTTTIPAPWIPLVTSDDHPGAARIARGSRVSYASAIARRIRDWVTPVITF
jgi:hypothetical protein